MPDNPGKPEPELKKPEIQIIPEEHNESPEVEVDLSASKTGDGAPDPTEKLRNQMFYEQRQLEKKILSQQRQMMEEFAQRFAGSNTQTPKQSTEKLDEFDEEVERVAQTDWRKAVDMRAERKANELFEKKLEALQAEQRNQETRQQSLRIEAKGREKVLNEFPNIMDESTPEFRAYMEIYNAEVAEDPLFIYNPRKHEIVLPELREKMKGKSYDTNPEIERLKRVAAGSSVVSRPNVTSSKIMLTQEEITMCKRSGIPIETYARTKKAGNAALKEGMVMDE